MKDYAAAVWIKGATPVSVEFAAHDNRDAVDHARTWATNQGFRQMRLSDPIKADGTMVPGYLGEGENPEKVAWLQVNRI